MDNGPLSSVPNEVSLHYQRAGDYYRQGRYAETEQELLECLTLDPLSIDALLFLGILLVQTGRHSEAAPILEAVIGAVPDQHDALIYLASAKRELNDLDSAVALCQRAIVLDPKLATDWTLLGICHLSMGRADLAIEALNQALQLDGRCVPAHHNLAMALRSQGDSLGACEAFSRAIEIAPGEAINYVELSRELQNRDDLPAAIACLERGLQAVPGSVAITQLLALALNRAEMPDRAQELFARVVELDPAATEAHAVWLQEQGLMDASIALLNQAIRLKPSHGFPYYGLARVNCFEANGRDLAECIEEVIDGSEVSVTSRMFLSFALGKAYEKAKRYEQAMERFDEAASLALRARGTGRSTDSTASAQYVESLTGPYTEEVFRRYSSIGSASETPVLIVGMIRSGTTLLDKLLSSHPEFSSAGELQYWRVEMEKSDPAWVGDLPKPEAIQEISSRYLSILQRLGGQARRVSDKMPLNYQYLGLIRLVFPRARIVHIRRNPLDTCLSIYTTYLGPAPGYAYDKRNIAAFYRSYMSLMSYWRELLPPEQFLEVDYEELVHDPRPILTEILEFCGLDWNDACLDSDRTEGTIRTPSLWQVRQPVNTRSIDRWRRYEPWLGEFENLKSLDHPSPRERLG